MNTINPNIQNNINQAGVTQPQTQQTGQIFKNQQIHTQPQTTPEQQVKQALDNIDRLINKVMDELRNADGTTQANKILQMAKDTKIAPDLTKDMVELVRTIDSDPMIENSPTLKDLTLKLKEFLKPIADLKSAPLNEQIKNSGIMLEGNLKEALNSQKIPPSIQKLLTDIKNLSNQNLLNQILTLANDESLDNNGSFLKLNQILKNETATAITTLNGSNLKSLFSDLSKLDNISKFLDKTAINPQISGDKVFQRVSNIQNFLSNLGEKISNLGGEKLNQITAFSSNIKELKSIIKDIQNSLNSLNKIGDEAGLVRAYNTLLSSDTSEATLQDKLSSAARRLGVALSLADGEANVAKSNLTEIKHLSRQLKLASNDVTNIEPKNPAETAKVLSSDIKSTLLAIQDKSANLNNSTQINQMSAKMLSQIEMHQMISSVSGGLQTYLPYVWDGVDGGRVAFKQGKKDRFYAQIDLNFKEYGQVNVMVGLSDKKYIDISIATAQNSFKELIMSENKELKRALSEIGLIVSNFNLKVLSKNEFEAKFKDFGGFKMGFDKRA